MENLDFLRALMYKIGIDATRASVPKKHNSSWSTTGGCPRSRTVAGPSTSFSMQRDDLQSTIMQRMQSRAWSAYADHDELVRAPQCQRILDVYRIKKGLLSF
jgi:hypothetical protein